MSTFSATFKINKTQAELDFVDIYLEGDIPLYIDPYALTSKDDAWSTHCHHLVASYFEAVLAAVRENRHVNGVQLLSHLGEPEETHLGVSQDGNKGRGIGTIQATQLFNALRGSAAARTGLLEDLSDFALFIPGIGRDKISDMTTNVIRKELILYTQQQCFLHDVPMRRVASGFFWNPETIRWDQDYFELPIYNNHPIILVPKYAVRYQVGVDHETYRSKFVLEFLKEKHLRADDNLVTILRDRKGDIRRKLVYKKTVDGAYPKTKDFLAEFSLEHPDIIERYKGALLAAAGVVPNINPDGFSEIGLARHLEAELKRIPAGIKSASTYHSLIIGIVSFLFFPSLIYPTKEASINEGRKRIDITYTNSKVNGFFYRVALDQEIKATTIHVECKNYSSDIANEEFDQLLGRFDRTRGRLGMLFYRAAENEERVISRSKDAVKAGQGVVIPINDAFVFNALNLISNGARQQVDRELETLFQVIIS